MRLDLPRDFYLPAAELNARRVGRPGTDAVVYVWTESHDGKDVVLAKGFAGRSNKPKFYFRFKSQALADAHVAKFLDSEAAHLAAKAERAAAVAAERAEIDASKSVPVGSFLTLSYGYDQTNQEAYQVVGHFGRVGVVVREVELSSDGGAAGAMSDHCKPVKDAFTKDAKDLRVRLTDGRGGKIGRHYAGLWDGRPLYRSWYA